MVQSYFEARPCFEPDSVDLDQRFVSHNVCVVAGGNVEHVVRSEFEPRAIPQLHAHTARHDHTDVTCGHTNPRHHAEEQTFFDQLNPGGCTTRPTGVVAASSTNMLDQTVELERLIGIVEVL